MRVILSAFFSTGRAEEKRVTSTSPSFPIAIGEMLLLERPADPDSRKSSQTRQLGNRHLQVYPRFPRREAILRAQQRGSQRNSRQELTSYNG